MKNSDFFDDLNSLIEKSTFKLLPDDYTAKRLLEEVKKSGGSMGIETARRHLERMAADGKVTKIPHCPINGKSTTVYRPIAKK